MPTQQLDILIKFLIDKSAVGDAQEAVMLLERAGVSYNEELGQFQDVESKKMVSMLEVTKRLTQAYNDLSEQVKPLSTVDIPIVGSKKALAVGAELVAVTKDWGMEVGEVAEEYAGLAGGEWMRADALEKSIVSAQEINKMSLKQLMTHEGIKDVNELNLDLGKQINSNAKATGSSVEAIAASHARGSTNSKETYGNILAAAKAAAQLEGKTSAVADDAARIK